MSQPAIATPTHARDLSPSRFFPPGSANGGVVHPNDVDEVARKARLVMESIENADRAMLVRKTMQDLLTSATIDTLSPEAVRAVREFIHTTAIFRFLDWVEAHRGDVSWTDRGTEWESASESLSVDMPMAGVPSERVRVAFIGLLALMNRCGIERDG